MDLSVAVVGKFVYVEPLEEMFARGFEQLGCKVQRESQERFIGDTDLTLCVKAPMTGRYNIRGKRALYFSDLTTRFPDQWNYLNSFNWDAVFLPHKEPVVDRKQTWHIPVAYDPQFHPDVKWDYDEKEPYALFIGTSTPDRQWLREYPHIKIYGNGWAGKRPDVYGELKLNLYRRCAYAINVHNPGETVNMRQFEVLAMGVPLLTDKAWPPFESKPGSDPMDVYDSHEGAVEAWSYYMERELDELSSLAEWGKKLVKPHTYANRCQAMLKIMELV
jgi:hypothetical protein